MIRLLSILMALSPLCLIGPAEATKPASPVWGAPALESTRADTFGFGFGVGLGPVDPVDRLLQSIETYAHGAVI